MADLEEVQADIKKSLDNIVDRSSSLKKIKIIALIKIRKYVTHCMKFEKLSHLPFISVFPFAKNPIIAKIVMIVRQLIITIDNPMSLSRRWAT